MILFVRFLFVISIFSSGDAKRRQNTVDPITEALKTKNKQNEKLNPVEAILNTLQDIILQKDPPKGEEFTKIPGPSKNDKVITILKLKKPKYFQCASKIVAAYLASLNLQYQCNYLTLTVREF